MLSPGKTHSFCFRKAICVFTLGVLVQMLRYLMSNVDADYNVVHICCLFYFVNRISLALFALKQGCRCCSEYTVNTRDRTVLSRSTSHAVAEPQCHA